MMVTGPSGVDGRNLFDRCRAVLEEAWDAERGYCYPHPQVYPHQWLWDSSFHSIAWAAVGDERALRELSGVFAAQLPNGFVPHMRYARPEMFRGPLDYASSYTQPPIFAHAARWISSCGFSIPRRTRSSIRRALDHLWSERRLPEGLIFIVHPWEAGSDDSPRWDSWVGSSEWNRAEWTAFDIQLVQETTWADQGNAVWSDRFVVAPAGFNALVAHALGEYGALADDPRYVARSRDLADVIDDVLWNDETGTWFDLPVVGGGASGGIPTLDGILPALVTSRPERADRALASLTRESAFGTRYGPSFVATTHSAYRADTYWRGAAWPQMSYLVRLAAARWDRAATAEAVAAQAIAATLRSGFSEFWNAETGEACGATPQTWAAVAAAYEFPALTPAL